MCSFGPALLGEQTRLCTLYAGLHSALTGSMWTSLAVIMEDMRVAPGIIVGRGVRQLD